MRCGGYVGSEGMKSDQHNPRIMKLFLLLGAVVLCVPTWVQVGWIVIFYRFPTHEARVAVFMDMVPWESHLATTLAALICSVAGILIGVIAVIWAYAARYPQSAGWLKAVAWVEILWGGVLAALLVLGLL